MRVFLTCILIIGFAGLMIIGLLSVVRDLLSINVLAAPTPLKDEHVTEIAENATVSSPVKLTSAGASH